MNRQYDTLLIAHVAADNDLSPYAAQIVSRLQLGTRHNPGAAAVALVDQLGEGNSRLYVFTNGQSWPLARLRELGPIELDMADPQLVGRFLRRTRQRLRARRTVATFIGHGTGPVPECEWLPAAGALTPAGDRVPGFPVTPQNHPLTPQNHPLTPQNHPLTPQNHPLTPGDLSSQRTMSTVGWGRALRLATDDGRDPFDVIFFDQCFQGSLDVLYELHPHGRVFIASPNYAWLRASYVKYLAAFAGAETPEALASRIITIYQATLNADHPNAIFWVRGGDVPAIADAVSALGRALQRLVAQGDEAAIERIAAAVRWAQFVDTGRALGQYDLGRGDELMGAGSFAANLRLAFPRQAGSGAGAVYEAADRLLRALQAVHTTHRVGVPYVAPEMVWGYTDGPTILAPKQRQATNEAAGVWRASLYRPADGFTAQWGPDPTQQVTVTRNLAYAHQGGWAPFINAWYLNELQPAVGQPLYVSLRAMALAAEGEREELALTAVRQGDGVTLDWSATSTPYSYQLFKRTPGYRWQLLAVTEATDYVDPYAALASDYRVVVFDDEDLGVAATAVVRA